MAEITTIEKALVRRLSFEPAPADGGKFYLSVFNQWREAGQCRLACEAMLAAGLDYLEEKNPSLRPPKEVGTYASFWVDSQIKQGNPLLRALLFAETLHSERRRRTIWQAIDTFGVRLEKSESDLWFDIREAKIQDKPLPTWAEIVRRFEVPTRWVPFPPARPSDQLEACLGLMPNPAEEDLPGIARSLTEEPRLEQMPALRRQIAAVAALTADPDLYKAIAGRDELFAGPIADLLTLAGQPKFDRTRKVKYLRGLEALARFLMAHLPAPKAGRQDLIDRLMARPDLPWLWPITKELCLATRHVGRIPQFLVRLGDSSPDGEPAFRAVGLTREEWHDLSNEIRARCQSVPIETITSLPSKATAARAVAALHRYLGQYRQPQFPEARAALIGLFQQDPALYRRIVGKRVRRGQISADFLSLYLEGVGFDHEEMQEWLINHQDHIPNKQIDTLVRQYILPHNLSAGCLLRSAHHREQLLGLGYVLRPEDVPLLAAEHIHGFMDTIGRRYNSEKNVWQNERWAETLLHHHPQALDAIGSLFATAVEWSDPLPRLRQTLLAPCTEDPRLQEALVTLAWDQTRPDGHILAQGFLLEEERYKRWDAERGRALMRQYVQKYLHLLFSMTNLKKTANAVFTLNEQVELFLSQPVSRGWPPHSPKMWRDFFASAEDRQRLRCWLLHRVNNIDASLWLEWVECFDFHNDPYTQRIIGTLSQEYDYESVRRKAMALRRSTTQKAD